MNQLGSEVHKGVSDQIGIREWARGASRLKTSPIRDPVVDGAEVKFSFCRCIEQNR